MNAHLLPYPYNTPLKTPRLLPFCRYAARILHSWHQGRLRGADTLIQPNTANKIRLVCISDTHNATPPVPNGDILIHAGDLTQHGTFEELQAQLTRLHALPHRHKFVIAGNHDLLLDDEFCQKFPDRAPSRQRHDLNWGDIVLLQDSSAVVNFPGCGIKPTISRQVKIFGSPKTPQFGSWAFQYPAIRDEWTQKIPMGTDVVVVHGPPVLHGDVARKGDGYLLRELRRVKPAVFVCRHIHAGHGIDAITHDGIETLGEEISLGWSGIESLCWMILLVLWSWVKVTLFRLDETVTETTVVNAAIAPGETGQSPNRAIEILL